MILNSEAALEDVGRRLAHSIQVGDVLTLSGPLGVGKTTLARAVLRAIGHSGEVPSPTFAIVQPYEALVTPIWHCDLYRIEHPEELEELGLDSALEAAALLVEWPERAGAAAWPQALRLRLDFGGAGARSLTAEVPAAWEGRWPFPR